MRVSRGLLLLWLVAAAALAVAPFVGVERLPWGACLDVAGREPAGRIFWILRVPRVLAAFLAGAGLAAAGAAFQAVFRNPLATPYTLGVSGGAAFGVALVTRLGLAVALTGAPLASLAAFVGALLAIGVVWGIAGMRAELADASLLLAGVAVSFFFSSMILFLQYTASLGDSFRVVRWLMGGLGAVDFGAVAELAPFVLVGALVLLLRARELDLLACGADLAASRGVDVAGTRKILFVATSVMVGGVVACCGPIGFVGLMAPHVCRLLLGGQHRRLLPASLLLGGAFLVVCDTVARVIIAPAELPVGVLTAFLGGPFFLWLLLRHAARSPR
jgi:iron complex transport system permease protein